MLPSINYQSIDTNKLDNINTYGHLNEIKEYDKMEDRLYFVQEENKYYRFDTNLNKIVLAFQGLTELTTGNNLTISDNIISTIEEPTFMMQL